MENRTEAVITLSSGAKMDLLNPKLDDIKIMDMVYGLAHKPHFSGQTKKFFSIAEHSVLCLKIEETLNFGVDKNYLLFHDANEAYLPDMIKPLKVLIPVWQGLEAGIQRLINKKVNAIRADYEKFKMIDIMAQVIEYKAFYPKNNLKDFVNKRLDDVWVERIENNTIFADVVKFYEPREAKIMMMEKCKELGIDIYS